MKLKLLLILYSVSVSCYSQKLLNKWFVIDESEFLEQVHYRTIYEFTKDSLYLNYLASGNSSYKILQKNNGVIRPDSIPDLKYKFEDDTLYIKWPSTTVRLLPLQKVFQSEYSLNDLNELFSGKIWSFESERNSFNITLLEELCFHEVRCAEVDVFFDGQYVSSFEPIWIVDMIDDQPVFILEDPFSGYYPNVFYIKSILRESILMENWYAGKKEEVELRLISTLDSEALVQKKNFLSKNWGLIGYSEFVDESEDSTLIDLGHIPVWDEINIKTVIEEKDIIERLLTFQFKTDSTFFIKTRLKEICKGRWQLRKNGTSVKVMTKMDFIEQHQTDCQDFIIKELGEDFLHIESYIPIYENDSTIPNRYFELKFSPLY